VLGIDKSRIKCRRLDFNMCIGDACVGLWLQGVDA